MIVATALRLIQAAAIVLALTATGFAQQTSPPTAVKFPIKSVRVEGNTLLSEDALSHIAQRVVGPDRSLADLRQAASAIQQAYREAGYSGVIAYVPQQELTEGDVVIKVVEGKLAQVLVEGNSAHDEWNIRHSLPGLKEGETPRATDIDRNIQIANENPSKQIEVELGAGAGPGDVDATVRVRKDERPLRVLVGFDNTGNPATGDYRASIGLQHANLWNRDHVFTAQYQTSPGELDLVKIYSAGYRIPLYSFSSSVDLFFAHSSVDSADTLTPAGSLQFTGKGDIAGLRFNHHLMRIGEYDQRIIAGIDWRRYDNTCALGSFGPAGCGPAGEDITVVPLILTYTGQRETPAYSWGTSISAIHNIGGSGEAQFDAVRSGATKHYTAFRWTAFAGRSLPNGFGVQARVSAQYSANALVPGEQFGLGGTDNVRGYRERELGGDVGIFLNLEALAPPVISTKVRNTGLILRPLVFVDYGHVFNHKDTPCRGVDTNCELASIGAGLRLSAGRSLYGRFDIGYALKDSTQKEQGDFRGHFALNLVF